MSVRDLYDRRQFLRGVGLAAGAAGLATTGLMGAPRAQVPPGAGADPRFLIVMGCSGGASIVDSLLAVRESESANADTLNVFPDARVTGYDDSPLRAVRWDAPNLGAIPAAVAAQQDWFVRKHRQQICVAPWERTSVNHAVGQRRSVTGNEAWLGRTLQECVAFHHGAGRPLPNVHLMGGSGYTELGTDRSLPTWAFGEQVADPAVWPLSLDAVKGIKGAPSRRLFGQARRLRDDTLDPASRFQRVFAQSQKLARWKRLRGESGPAIEALALIDKLMVFPESARYPLGEFGLVESPVAARVREVFPDYAADPLQAQAALAYLLIRYGVSVTVTIGPGGAFKLDPEYAGFELGGGIAQGTPDEPLLPAGAVKNPPIGFDFSHNGHRSVQAMMWERMYRVADGLQTLLAETEFEGTGGSLWDRSMVYFATDFGRSRRRAPGASEFESGHSVNNGVAVLSPLVRGNTVLGGVDPDTTLTYGCDPRTGAPEVGRHNTEGEVFSGLLQALKVDTSGSGLPDFGCMVPG